MNVIQRALQAVLLTAATVHAFSPSGSVKPSTVVLKANGYTGQFSDFYENVGYKPKTDMGHDGQTFTPVYGGGLAEKTGRPQPAAPGEDINARPGFMMTGVFSGFHDSVGYKPLSDVGNDAQPFASVSETTAQS